MNPFAATLLIGGDRMLYAGPLRRSLAPRRLGALSIYVAPGPFDIAVGNGPRRNLCLAIVPPHLGHWITPPQGPIWNLLIEPESTTPEALARLCDKPPGRLFERLRELTSGDGFTTEAFDVLSLGAALPLRKMDPRSSVVIDALRADPVLNAQDCARAVGLSTSRLLHLFRQDTGMPFRDFRMWKRARRFLDRAAGTASLTEMAIRLGYPDSSHFSHSIRRTFGMGPSVMRVGARGMQVRVGDGYSLFQI